MFVTLRADRTQGYLCAVVTGVFGLAASQRASLRILEACARHGLSRVLIDIRALGGTLSTMSDFEWAASLAGEHARRVASGLPPVRFVILGERPRPGAASPSQRSAAAVAEDHFAETVMVNRGLDARFTTDPAEALEWLGVRPATAGPAPAEAVRQPRA